MKKKNIVIICIFSVLMMLILGIVAFGINIIINKTNNTEEEQFNDLYDEVSAEIYQNQYEDLENENSDIVNEEIQNNVVENNEISENNTANNIVANENKNIAEKNTNNVNVVNTTTVKNNVASVVQSSKYYLKVNYGAQVVTAYTKDAEGKYTIPVRAMVCSTGTATPTSGVYATKNKWTWHQLFGGVYGHYSTHITGDILFHSVPYLRNGDNASLEYWAYDKLGTRASMGCVRLTTIDAKWIFNNCPIGTKVEFYSDPNPGPLGKPTAKKISNSGNVLRNWDPTDPAPNNPWKNVKDTNEQNTTNKNETNQANNNQANNNQANNNAANNNQANNNQANNNATNNNATNNNSTNNNSSNNNLNNNANTNNNNMQNNKTNNVETNKNNNITNNKTNNAINNSNQKNNTTNSSQTNNTVTNNNVNNNANNKNISNKSDDNKKDNKNNKGQV